MSVTPDQRVTKQSKRLRNKKDVEESCTRLDFNAKAGVEESINEEQVDEEEEEEEDLIDLQEDVHEVAQKVESETSNSVSSDSPNEHDDAKLSAYSPRTEGLGPFKTSPLQALKSGRDHTVDTIHGQIFFDPTIKAFTDSLPFQRLKSLKQLGVADVTYMNATHNRKEHSLGVYHVSTKMVETLRDRQPYLNINSKDVLCVGIAGLCHDLGHGPFSHVYDGEFMSKLRKEIKSEREKEILLPHLDWTHEIASLMMIDFILEGIGLAIDESELDSPLKQIGDGIRADCFGVYSEKVPLPDKDVLTSRDLIFVKECILGAPLAGHEYFMGRRPEENKEFLYDIVSNRHNGLDVDKFDYFMRDASRTLGTQIQFQKLIHEAFVAKAVCSKPEKCCLHPSQCLESRRARAASFSIYEEDTEVASTHLMICYPEKLVEEAYSFFHTRFQLHRKVYTHKTSKAAEYMVCDILARANRYKTICVKEELSNKRGRDGYRKEARRKHYFHISNAMKDPRAYIMLNDSIIDQIYESPSDELDDVQDLIRRYKSRDLYKHVSSQDHERESGIPEIVEVIWRKSEEDIKNELLRLAKSLRQSRVSLEPDDVIVEKLRIHHGMKHENPVLLMRFLKRGQVKLLRNIKSPDELPKAEQINPQHFQTYFHQEFQDRCIRLYCRASTKDDGAQEKADFIDHLFIFWINNLKEDARRSPHDGPSITDENYCGTDYVMLTQE